MSNANGNGEQGRREPAERLGRKLGIALFWLLLAYTIGMSAVSIIPALYFPEIAPNPPPLPAGQCEERIRTLAGELVAKTASTVRRGEMAGLDRWLSSWDKRSLALAGGCGALEPARRDLLELRADIGTLLATYREGPLPVQQRLERALEHWPPRTKRPGS